MASVGGCCPLVVPAAPAVGPAPASRAAISLVRLSISVAHGPATADPIGTINRAHAPNRNVLVFITFSPVTSESHEAFRTAILAVPTEATNQMFRDWGGDSACGQGGSVAWNMYEFVHGSRSPFMTVSATYEQS